MEGDPADARNRLLPVTLAALIVAGISAAWGAGLFGPVTWQAIDVVRLLAEVLLMIAALVAFSRPALRRDRRQFPVLAIMLLAQTPLALNSKNPMVQVAAAAMTVFVVVLLVVAVLRNRRERKEMAG